MKYTHLLYLAAAATICSCSGDDNTVPANAQDDANDKVEAILSAQPKANPYDVHLPKMPDKGCQKLKINLIGGSLGQVFNDSNHVHLEAAKVLGVKPMHGLQDVWDINRPMVKIESCSEYFVDSLTHSVPYLVPEAANLLSDIGKRFNDELQARGGGSYRLKVTSVTRTPNSVAKLKKINRNATEESAHQYGTTMDISYTKFICDDSINVRRTQEDLKNLLGEVLNEMRNEGRCYVKYERKQGCFHITARK